MVEMLSSFLSGLSGNKRVRRGSPGPGQTRSQGFSTGDDREEDGFLFLGATHSEQSTTDSTFQADAPPTYESEAGLPSFAEVMHARESTTNYQPMSLPTEVHQQHGAAADLTRTAESSTTLYDIPFQLSRDLEISADWENHLFHVPALPPMDNSRYRYDFACEKSVMHEITSEEMRLGTFRERTDSSRTPSSQNTTDSISESVQTMRASYSVPDLISFD